MTEKTPVPELGHPTVAYQIWSTLSRSLQLVEITPPEIEQLEDTELQDALWLQLINKQYGDRSQAVVVYTSAEHGTHSYLVPTRPSSL